MSDTLAACVFVPPHEPFFCAIHADVRLRLTDERCRRAAPPPEAGLREEPWRPLDGHNHDGEGYPTFPVFRLACPQGCDAASAPLPDGRPRSVVIDPLDPRLLRSIGVPPSVADAADASSRGGAPPPEAGLREAGWNGLIDDLHAAFDQGHMRVASIVDRWRPMIDGAALASPADPPSEPDGKSTANNAKVSRPADPPSEPKCLTCGLPDRGHDDSHGFHPRPADPDMEERLAQLESEARNWRRGLDYSFTWTDALELVEMVRAARLIAQGWRR